MPSMLSGLSVLTPAAWWAMSALAIPLLIHLFSRSRGRLVHIGHIDLIRHARKVKVTELRFTQWLLLMLRLAIFTLAALILAGLVTTGTEDSADPAVYMTPEWLQNAGAEERDAVFQEAATRPGTRLFLLQPGFPQVDRATMETLALPSALTSASSGSAWTLLAERLGTTRHDGPVTVYATDLLRQFGRDRPALPGDITWRTSHPPAVQGPVADSIRALLTYDADRADDARRVEAALAVLKAHRLPGLLWESIELGQAGDPPPGVDWLIRLGNGAADTAAIERTGSPLVILSDAFDTGEDVPEQLLSLPFYPFSQFRVARLSRSQETAPGHEIPTEWRTLISTGEPTPVLQESRVGLVRVLQFNSRFDPGWSSLVQQAEFPELLLQMMLEPGQDVQRFAAARIAPADLPGSAAATVAENLLPRRSLQQLLAFMLAILWIAERSLSERRPRAGR